MKLGYLHINKEEQNKVMQILKLLTEPTSLDELGIGRIRDAFADKMFPGTSTLQKHAKYFSLMPQLYLRAVQKKYNRVSEVKSEIIRLEKRMTEMLMIGSPNATGITGSERISKKSNEYVKYDPAYIYNSGLLTYEILKGGSLHELIYSASKHLHNSPRKLKNEDLKKGDDTDDLGNFYQFCSLPSNLEYDFMNSCNLTLTPSDITFIKGHMLKAKACQGTLLKFIIEHDEFPLSSFRDIDESLLPAPLAKLHKNAQAFSDFIYLAHLRYNWIFSRGTDQDIKAEFDSAMIQYQQKKPDINEILSEVQVKEKSCIIFCEKMARSLNSKDNFHSFDELIRIREKQVKNTRHKLDSKHEYDSANPIHHHQLTYRWNTVSTFIEELRGKEVTNG